MPNKSTASEFFNPNDKKEKTPNKARTALIRFGAAIAIASTAAGVSLGLSGCSTAEAKTGHSVSQTPTEKATKTADPSTPDATPSPTFTPETAPKLGTIPASMENLQQMSADQFNSEPEATRLQYFAALFGGEANIKDFADNYYRYTQDPNDLLPDTISEDNTPQQILTVLNYGMRLPYALSGEDRDKAASAAFIQGESSTGYGSLANALAKDPSGMTGTMVAANNLVQNGTLVNGSSLETDAAGNKYVTLTIDNNGETNNYAAFYVSTTYDGQPFNWWIWQ